MTKTDATLKRAFDQIHDAQESVIDVMIACEETHKQSNPPGIPITDAKALRRKLIAMARDAAAAAMMVDTSIDHFERHQELLKLGGHG